MTLIPYAGKDREWKPRQEPLLHPPFSTGNEAVILDGTILALWRLGMDTLDISRKLVVSEAFAANKLAAVLDRKASP